MLKGKIGIESALTKLAAFQCRYYKQIILAAVILTLFFGYGATNLHFQGNIEKEMPKDLPVYVLQEKIVWAY